MTHILKYQYAAWSLTLSNNLSVTFSFTHINNTFARRIDSQNTGDIITEILTEILFLFYSHIFCTHVSVFNLNENYWPFLKNNACLAIRIRAISETTIISSVFALRKQSLEIRSQSLRANFLAKVRTRGRREMSPSV